MNESDNGTERGAARDTSEHRTPARRPVGRIVSVRLVVSAGLRAGAFIHIHGSGA